MLIAKEGIPFIIVPLLIGLIALFFGRIWVHVGIVFIVLGLFCAFFFRNPSRNIPKQENIVLGPADGKVMEVTEEDGIKVIRIFLSVFNVHIQRSPISGEVQDVIYKPGKFLPAMNKLAHIENEQNVIKIKASCGDFVVKQIAGILARRVVSWVKPQDTIVIGERIGLIKFSSQVDLYVPDCVDIKVKQGDKIIAGETIMGVINE